MLFESVLFLLVLALAYSNGANDISKGIATLVGSGISNIRRAVVCGVITTALGSIAAVVFGDLLLKVFSGGVLVEGKDPAGIAAGVAAGAAIWVFLAARTGMPVSTTHALVGGIVGAGIAKFGVDGIVWAALTKKALLPLIISPVVAFGLSYTLFPLVRRKLSKSAEDCICVQETESAVATATGLTMSNTALEIVSGDIKECRTDQTNILAMSPVDSLHFFSAGLTSFARGLNDTPKMAALLLGVQALGASTLNVAYAGVGIGVVVGGLVGGKRVINTLAKRVASLDPVTGFASNAITATLVTVGSFFGLPFSTTHVSTSSIVGIGVASGEKVQWKVVRDILLAWLVTLPSAAVMAFLFQKMVG